MQRSDYVPVLLADTTAEPIGNRFERTNYEASELRLRYIGGQHPRQFIGIADPAEKRLNDQKLTSVAQWR